MKNSKIKRTIAALSAAAILAAMPAAYAETGGDLSVVPSAAASANKLPPGTGFDSMTAAHPTACTATLTKGETAVTKAADENGKITFYLSSETADIIKINVSTDPAREKVASLCVKPRTFAEYAVEGLTPGGNYLITFTAEANGKALIY